MCALFNKTYHNTQQVSKKETFYTSSANITYLVTLCWIALKSLAFENGEKSTFVFQIFLAK